LDEIVRTVEGTLGPQSALAGEGNADLEFSAEDWSEGGIAWLTSERSLVGVWRHRSAPVTPFVAVMLERPAQVFPRWQRDLARMALIHQTESAAWAPSGAPPSRQTLSEVVLRRIGVGLVVVDADGRVRLANGSAEHWFASERLVALVRGRLIATRPDVREELGKALLGTTGDPPRRPSIVALPAGDCGGPPGLLTFIPINHQTPHALVICGSWGADTGLSDLVFEALGLTVAERRLACLLVGGRSLDEAARQANVTVSTARSYLKHIFAKIGVRRQSELVAYVLGMMPPLHLEELGAVRLIAGSRSSDRAK
jgi:DNA-binding CsgD family transcriptional regulator